MVHIRFGWNRGRMQIIKFLLSTAVLQSGFYLLLQDLTAGFLPGPASIINVVILQALFLLLLAFAGTLKRAVAVEAVFLSILSMAEQCLYRFRGTYLSVWDLACIGTAASVAGSYDLSFGREQAGTVLAFLFVSWVACLYIPESRPGRKERVCLFCSGIFSSVLATAVFLFTAWIPYEANPFDTKYEAARNGLICDFLYDLKSIKPKPPEGYDRESANKKLSSFCDEPKGRTPDIIAVMCEAFSDPAVLGEVKTNRDYMPFIHSLLTGASDTVSGTLNVSVIGGGTVNTEYEFLSGNSMRFFPQGSYPYMQSFHQDTDTSYMLPAWMNAMGYETVFLHPGEETGYRRREVYEQMGFGRQLYKKDMEHQELIRDYVSDQSVFGEIMELYRKKGDSPMFCFAVTVQNHGYYSDKDPQKLAVEKTGVKYLNHFSYSGNIRAEGENDEALETYLSLESITDRAVKDLSEWVDSLPKDTVLLFFGDHQPGPSVTRPIAEPDLEIARYYKVPFFIHANFDIEEQTGIDTSANYLQSLLFDICGMGRNRYQMYLREMRGKNPVLSVYRECMDKEAETECQKIQFFLTTAVPGSFNGSSTPAESD